MFVSFDGVDGTGKTTQINLFADWLRTLGHDVITCRDPGTTPLGERIRGLLLKPDAGVSISARGEMLLYMAARAQLVEEFILPALTHGRTVVSDRFLLANVVYQGYGGGLDVEKLWSIGEFATAGLEPDWVVVLDMSPVEASRRIARGLDRMERQDAQYRERLREGFLAEARRRPDRIVVVDASQSVDQVQATIRQVCRERLP
jgi:dTMP kinase